jgi:hypothetical protein
MKICSRRECKRVADIQYYKTEEQAVIARDQFIIDNKLDVTKYKLNYPMDFYD